jgi:PadR family transcriptional regulator, regulatory protein AphA
MLRIGMSIPTVVRIVRLSLSAPLCAPDPEDVRWYSATVVSLRHALLGVIKDTPLTGYDLVRHFQGTVGYVWSAPQSQIYPELRRMEAEGLITAKVAPRGKKAQKRIYSITDAGMQELRRWATDFMPLPAQRDPIMLKAAFFDLGTLESMREQLRAHIAQFQWRMEQWQARVEAIRDRRAELVEVWLTRQPVEEHDNIIQLKIHALEGLIARARAEIGWARNGLALCDEIEARRANAHPEDSHARASG